MKVRVGDGYEGGGLRHAPGTGGGGESRGRPGDRPGPLGRRTPPQARRSGADENLSAPKNDYLEVVRKRGSPRIKNGSSSIMSGFSLPFVSHTFGFENKKMALLFFSLRFENITFGGRYCICVVVF